MRVHRFPALACLAAAGADAVELRGAARRLDRTGRKEDAAPVATRRDYAHYTGATRDDNLHSVGVTNHEKAAPTNDGSAHYTGATDQNGAAFATTNNDDAYYTGATDRNWALPAITYNDYTGAAAQSGAVLGTTNNDYTGATAQSGPAVDTTNNNYAGATAQNGMVPATTNNEYTGATDQNFGGGGAANNGYAHYTGTTDQNWAAPGTTNNDYTGATAQNGAAFGTTNNDYTHDAGGMAQNGAAPVLLVTTNNDYAGATDQNGAAHGDPSGSAIRVEARYAPWFYLDPQGKIQGPFGADTMRRWHEAGYFEETLPLSQDRDGPFDALSSIFPDPSDAFLATVDDRAEEEPTARAPRAQAGPIVWGFEYVVEHRMRDWRDHRQAALDWGGQLASVRAAGEQEFVVSITDRDASYFLGGYRVDDSWRWTDGAPWSYLHWAEGEPSNSNNVEDKLSLKKDGTWNDVVCGEHAGGKQRGAVFKRPVRSPAAVPALFYGDEYRVEHDARSWDEHARAAAAWGGRLASVRSAEEQELVRSITERGATYFLGGARVDGLWTWTDGTPWNYVHWAAEEPNVRDEREDRLSLKGDGTWNDIDGTGGKKRAAVYKRKYSTIAPTTTPTTAPTYIPTTAPTTAPTISPTIAPTTAPTTAPMAVPVQTPGSGVGIDTAVFATRQTPGPTSGGTVGACGACAGDACFFPAAGYCYNLAGTWYDRKITRIRGGAGCAEAYDDKAKYGTRMWRQCEGGWIELVFNGKKVSDVSDVCCRP